jgi:hypothetical protein
MLYPETIRPSLLCSIKPVVLQKLSSGRSVSGVKFHDLQINALSFFEISFSVTRPNGFFFSAGKLFIMDARTSKVSGRQISWYVIGNGPKN